MNFILAADEQWAIGNRGGVLVHLPGDMKFFRRTTRGKTVVMGRKTFESLPGGALKNRENIVLSRADYAAEGAAVVHTVEELQARLVDKAEDEVFCIGGGEIYRLLLPYAQKIYLTRIYKTFAADTYFPDLDKLGGWECRKESELFSENGVEYRFLVYERAAAGRAGESSY